MFAYAGIGIPLDLRSEADGLYNEMSSRYARLEQLSGVRKNFANEMADIKDHITLASGRFTSPYYTPERLLEDTKLTYEYVRPRMLGIETQASMMYEQENPKQFQAPPGSAAPDGSTAQDGSTGPAKTEWWPWLLGVSIIAAGVAFMPSAGAKEKTRVRSKPRKRSKRKRKR